MALVSALGFSQTKTAFVNFSELVQLMPQMDTVRSVINASQKEGAEAYKEMEDEFNSKYQTYQAKVASWPASLRESKEKELTELQQRIQEFAQNFQSDLQQQQQALMAPVYNKAQQVVENLAKAGGYAVVYDKVSVLYIDPAQCADLTEAARKALGIPEGRTLETLQAELQAAAAQE